MAVSNSTDLSTTRDLIIREALEILGVYDPNEGLSSADVTSCSRTLEFMVKAWQADGIHLWKYTEQTINMVDGTNTYTPAPRVLRVHEARYRTASDSIDTPLLIVSRKEYMELTDKSSEGSRPTILYYSPTRDSGTVYLWPTPSNSTDSVILTAELSIMDFDGGSNEPDFPQEWYQALAWGLAERSATKYGRADALQYIKPLANEYLMQVKYWDQETASVQITPDLRFR